MTLCTWHEFRGGDFDWLVRCDPGVECAVLADGVRGGGALHDGTNDDDDDDDVNVNDVQWKEIGLAALSVATRDLGGLCGGGKQEQEKKRGWMENNGY